MRRFTKVMTLLFAFLLAIGLLESTGVKAGPAFDEECIWYHVPEFEVEAVENETGIKVIIPAQSYFYSEYTGVTLYPLGYKIIIERAGDTEYKKPTDYSVGLYDKHYTNFSAGGYGPYKVEEKALGKEFYLEQSGDEERTYVLNDLAPGEYSVRVRAYDIHFAYDENGNLDYSDYNTNIKLMSEETEKHIVLTEQTVEEVKIKPGYKNKYDFSKVKKGDVIKFGAYEQDAVLENGREPIEWIVLDKTEDSLFVLSKYVLDKLPFNNGYTEVTWADSTLRKWLNEAFYDFAFNKAEKKLIKTVTLKNEKNPDTGVSGGKDTKDKIFILSLSDVKNAKYGFSKKALTHDENRRTSYAWNENAGGRWWLRTPAYSKYRYLFVGSEGGLEYVGGSSVNGYQRGIGVRPAMYIKLK